LRLMFIRNEASVPGSWRISPQDANEVVRLLKGTGLTMVGTFHSHPISEAVPGSSDLAKAKPGSLLLIYDVCGRAARLWRVRRERRGKRTEAVALHQTEE